jgi:glycosyltransferase involved in cell wall biosynthesis
VIPTKNSDATIEPCIKSIRAQSYSNIEIIIVDSNSTDNTVKMSQKMGCKVLFTDWKLLGARYEGLKAASGDYILMLDSDQMLERSSVERSIVFFENYDMLCLEEMTFTAKTFVEKLFEADRKIIHEECEIQLHPVYGTLLARFYKKDLLEEAFKSIPETLFPFVVFHDHAIIYYEAWRLSNKVTIVPNAVWHKEAMSIIELWKKNFRYGRSTKELLKRGHYKNFVKKKTFRFRQTRSKVSKDKFLSSFLLLLKAPAYLIGLYI